MNTRFDEKTWIPLGGTLAIVVAIGIAVWRVNDVLNDLRGEIRAASTDRWQASDMQEWSYQLRDQNRERALAVPSPRTVRAERLASEAGR